MTERTYSELIQIPTILERFDYLKLVERLVLRPLEKIDGLISTSIILKNGSQLSVMSLQETKDLNLGLMAIQLKAS